MLTSRNSQTGWRARPSICANFNLADGSLVHRKGWSRAYADLRGPDRKVELTHGEAFFDVEHDAVHPFTVTVANATVRAVGTQFDVNLVAALLTVTVKAGSVNSNRLAARWRPLRSQPGSRRSSPVTGAS